MKRIIFTMVVIIILSAGLIVFNNSQQKEQTHPIIEHFACSDYCPGPAKDYTIMIYEGIRDEKTCLEIGGEPYTYTGWGTTFVCKAK